jgi:hypothetical protein
LSNISPIKEMVRPQAWNIVGGVRPFDDIKVFGGGRINNLKKKSCSHFGHY